MTVSLISVGVVRRAHGKDGLVQVTLTLDDPGFFQDLKEVFIDDSDGSQRPLKVLHARPVHNGILVKFETVNSRADAEVLLGNSLRVPSDRLNPLKDWNYYHFQLIGLSVKTVQELNVGVVTEILETGANDVYIVRNDEGIDFLIPAIRSVIKSIDLDSGVIVIDPLENMLL
ncbi:ribosome maturation factor RimM [bacterium]|nr:ribosome maturation factor RimM [bacterium]